MAQTLQAFKYHHEEEVQRKIDELIQFCGDKALSFYKARSGILKGVHHLRTEKMIQYHISEVLKDIQNSQMDFKLGDDHVQ